MKDRNADGLRGVAALNVVLTHFVNLPIMAAVLLSFAVYRPGLCTNLQAAPLSGSTVWLKSFFHDGITVPEVLRNALYGAIAQGDGTLVPPLWTLKIEFIGSLYLLAFYLIKPRAATLLPMLLAFLPPYAVHRDESIYYYVIFLGRARPASARPMERRTRSRRRPTAKPPVPALAGYPVRY